MTDVLQDLVATHACENEENYRIALAIIARSEDILGAYMGNFIGQLTLTLQQQCATLGVDWEVIDRWNGKRWQDAPLKPGIPISLRRESWPCGAGATLSHESDRKLIIGFMAPISREVKKLSYNMPEASVGCLDNQDLRQHAWEAINSGFDARGNFSDWWPAWYHLSALLQPRGLHDFPKLFGSGVEAPLYFFQQHRKDNFESLIRVITELFITCARSADAVLKKHGY